MLKVEQWHDDLRKEILEFLYRDEILNIEIIHSLENGSDRTGHIYLERTDRKIIAILQIQFDGNSNFTNFYAADFDGLNAIARQIKDDHYDKQLIAGKKSDVAYIFKQLERERPIEKSLFYKLNQQKSGTFNIRNNIAFRKVNEGDEVDPVKTYLIDFFGADSDESIAKITSDEKIDDMKKNGLYLLYDGAISVGMARFLGFSKSYICLTTVYIDPVHRSKGYGKSLIAAMIEEAHKMNKTPVLQVHADNKSAIRIYEDLGFELEEEYAFEFVE